MVACNRCLAIDNPLDVPKRRQEAFEGFLIGKGSVAVEEGQLASRVGVEGQLNIVAKRMRAHTPCVAGFTTRRAVL